jgi:hypothetical protein
MSKNRGKFKFPTYVPVEARGCITSWLDGSGGVPGLVERQVADKVSLAELKSQMATAIKNNDTELSDQLSTTHAEAQFVCDHNGKLIGKIEALACEPLMKDAYQFLSQAFKSNVSQWSAYLDAALFGSGYDFHRHHRKLIECRRIKGEVSKTAKILAKLLTELDQLSGITNGNDRQTSDIFWPTALIFPDNLTYTDRIALEVGIEQARLCRLEAAGFPENEISSTSSLLIAQLNSVLTKVNFENQNKKSKRRNQKNKTSKASPQAAVGMLDAILESSSYKREISILRPKSSDIVGAIAVEADEWAPKGVGAFGATESRKPNTKMQYLRAFWHELNHSPFCTQRIATSDNLLKAMALTATVMLAGTECDDVSIQDVKHALKPLKTQSAD